MGYTADLAEEIDEVTAEGYHEKWAEEHADQYIGCVGCRHSHHETAFCHNCGRCHFKAEIVEQNAVWGTFVKCACGKINLWD